MERRLAAIFFADLVGYSSRMEQDETGTYALVKSVLSAVFEPQIAHHRGRIVKLMGDCVMAEFPSVLDAVHCALKVQSELAICNEDAEEEDRFSYRIGVNLGDIILDGQDLYGDMVNIASRVESLAGPGEVWVTRPVRDQIRDRVSLPLEDRGSIKVRNIARPVRVFRLVDDNTETFSPARRSGWIVRNRTFLAAAALAGLMLYGLLPTDGPERSENLPTAVQPKSGSYVSRARANVRDGPGKEFDVLRTVDPGTNFELTGSIEEADGTWYRVRSDQDNKEGFVFSYLLVPAPAEGLAQSVPEHQEHEVTFSALHENELPSDLAPEPENAPERIWFSMSIDASNSAWQDCSVYGIGSVHSVEKESGGAWTSIHLKDRPEFDLKVRARHREEDTLMEVWPYSQDWPESRKMSIPLASIQPGVSGHAVSNRRALPPLAVCGRFWIHIDVLEEPEEDG
ncbi:MAG: adenylate/guanylate cyclase domain-containing protein [Pseudomonadota bacterium]